MTQEQHDYSPVKKMVFDAVAPWKLKDVLEFVNKGIMPKLDVFKKTIPKPVKTLLRAAYIQHSHEFDMVNFIRALRIYRPDLKQIYESERGQKWMSIFLKKLVDWFKTL